ncbi:MAG TPA: TonB-dependent receptor [Caulobacter sp.]|nr:TonB-dependent receptor [Caulobacter sp.]
MRRASLFSTGVAALALAASTAAAQAPVDTLTYPASFYAPYSPQTALDMVQRTPGFVLAEGEQLRGFGGGSGNVLIDGARPASKSGGLEDALRRIPASHVERVEVVRGAQTAEAQGQSTVLNIVRRRERTGGAWSAEMERNGGGLIYPRLEATLTGQAAGWDATVKANAFWEQYPYRTLRTNRDADGDLTSTWIDDRPTTLTEGFLSGEASRALAGGMARLNGRMGWQRFYYDQESDIFLARAPGGSPDQTNLFEYDREDWTLEVGGDYTREVPGWTWKTLGLANAKIYGQEQSDVRRSAGGALVARSDARLSQLPVEALLRTTLAGRGGGAIRPEVGAEIAYNRLESRFSLTTDNGSGPVPVELSAADVLVQEWRGEAFFNGTWAVNDSLTLEGALAVEGSCITVTGDVENEQSFLFLKPAAAVVWRPFPELQVRVGALRRVGQLNFTDFAASAELQDDQAVAGNPALEPEKIDRLSAAIDYRGARGLAVNVEFYLERRDDVLEQVRLPSGTPGLANAGTAEVLGVKANATLPLQIVAPGLSLKAEGEVRETSFDDPLTGRARDLSGFRSPIFKLELIHAPPGGDWNWGVNVASYDGVEGAQYLVDQIDFNRYGPTVGGYVETSAISGLLVRLSVRNAATERNYRLRTFYAPDRSGALLGTDERESARGVFVTLRVSGRF